MTTTINASTSSGLVNTAAYQAIMATYPSVGVIRGNDAFDAEGNAVVYDETAVQAKYPKS
jgi:hypothetical protein